MHVVFEFLGERIRHASVAAHVHPHGQVLALDVRGRNVRPIRVAFDPALLGTSIVNHFQ